MSKESVDLKIPTSIIGDIRKLLEEKLTDLQNEEKQIKLVINLLDSPIKNNVSAPILTPARVVVSTQKGKSKKQLNNGLTLAIIECLKDSPSLLPVTVIANKIAHKFGIPSSGKKRIQFMHSVSAVMSLYTMSQKYPPIFARVANERGIYVYSLK